MDQPHDLGRQDGVQESSVQVPPSPNDKLYSAILNREWSLGQVSDVFKAAELPVAAGKCPIPNHVAIAHPGSVMACPKSESQPN
jgi:hypothetical protein